MTRICLVLSCVVAVALADLAPSTNYGVPNYQTGGNNYQSGYQNSGYQYNQPQGGCNRLTGQGCGGPIQTLPAPLPAPVPAPLPCGFNGQACRPTGPVGGCNSITGQGCGGQGPIQSGGTTVTKHVYVHVPPPEPEEQRKTVVQQGITAQKHYKIIFIKTPSLDAQQQQIIRQQQQQQEEKTLIYVLSKRPEELEEQVIEQQSRPSVINKPEVYFIKYKTQSQKGGNVATDFGTGSESGSAISSTSTGNQGYNANAQPY